MSIVKGALWHGWMRYIKGFPSGSTASTSIIQDADGGTCDLALVIDYENLDPILALESHLLAP